MVRNTDEAVDDAERHGVEVPVWLRNADQAESMEGGQ